jgi:hypothetical protein
MNFKANSKEKESREISECRLAVLASSFIQKLQDIDKLKEP